MTNRNLRLSAFAGLLTLLISCNNAADTKESTGDSVSNSADTAISRQQVAAPATVTTVPRGIEGVWELTYISGPKIAFDGLYPDKKPQLNLSTAGKVTGFTGCNRLNGPVKIDSSKISFSDMITTKMACQGQGEMVFLNTLKKVNTFSITNDSTLHLIMGDIALMNFKRVQE